MPKNWCFWTVVLEKTLESPLDCKEIKPVNSKGNQPWIFTRRTDAEAPILWPPYVKSRLFGGDPDAGKDWGQEEKGETEDEMVGWHHWPNGHKLEQITFLSEIQSLHLQMQRIPLEEFKVQKNFFLSNHTLSPSETLSKFPFHETSIQKQNCSTHQS